jgi:Domain of unknown function (DUF4269)
MSNINFKDISYLNKGNIKQRKSYEILTKINIFNILYEFNPVLAGTIPIEIDIENSDLDIICEIKDFGDFKRLLENNFNEYINFTIMYDKENSVLVCNFEVEGIEIEIYASRENTYLSNGYRHMLIEHRLLLLGGESFRNNIINLKNSGLKTEPAFAKLLGLKGNPYEELLILEKYSDEEIIKKIKRGICT